MLEWLILKIVAVLMILAGGFLVLFFPGIVRHQEAGGKSTQTSFGVGGIVIGLVLIIAGGFLLFSP